MNTRISYLYRDADNYKHGNSCVVTGVLSEEQIDAIMESLDGGEWFVPQDVGLPAARFDTETDADHPWFELRRDGFELTEADATVEVTAEELLSRFRAHKDGWSDDTRPQGSDKVSSAGCELCTGKFMTKVFAMTSGGTSHFFAITRREDASYVLRSWSTGSEHVGEMPIKVCPCCGRVLDDAAIPESRTPGSAIWCIERGEDGEMVDFSGYVFVAENSDCILAASNPGEPISPYLIGETRGASFCNVYAFPKEDAFQTREEAAAAMVGLTLEEYKTRFQQGAIDIPSADSSKCAPVSDAAHMASRRTTDSIVWCVERGEDGKAEDCSGYVFVAENSICVLVAAHPGEPISPYLISETRSYSGCEVYAFPREDVFQTREEAVAAVAESD